MTDFRALYLRWHARVLTISRQMLANPDEAGEATQEVFIEAWRKLDRYDPFRGSEWAWLRAMTHARCLDRLRSNERRSRATQRATDGSGENEPPVDPSDLSALLSKLPDSLRAPIELSYLLGFTHREIAERMGEPLGTIKTRIRTGIARLAGRVKPPRSAEPARLGAVRAAGRPRV